MSNLKICLVTIYNPFEKNRGGLDSANYVLSTYFASLGIETWVLTLGAVGKDTITTANGVNFWILPDCGYKDIWRRSFLFLRRGKSIIEQMERESGINIFTGDGGFAAPLLFAHTRQAYRVLTIHDLDSQEIADIKDCLRLKYYGSVIDDAVKFPFRKLWRLIYLSKADALIFTTEVPLNDWKRFYPHSGQKRIYTSGRGNPPSEDNQGNGNKKECDFVYFARIGKHKGVDLIIKAICLLKNNRVCPSLIILGDGPWREKMEHLSNKLGLSMSVTFLGYVDEKEKKAQISKSKFSVSPSFYEGFGLTIEESFALGVPVVVSDIPIFKTRVNASNGYIFKTGDYHNLAEVMQKALDMNSEEYQKMSRNANSSVIDKSWPDTAKRYIEIYEDIIK